MLPGHQKNIRVDYIRSFLLQNYPVCPQKSEKSESQVSLLSLPKGEYYQGFKGHKI
jgi:hypothetical protein